MKFLNPSWSVLIVILPLVFIVIVIFEIKREQIKWMGTQIKTRKTLLINSILLFLAILLAILALMRPVSGYRERTIKVQGRDIIILLDASRSMLAEDIIPNRFDRAVIAIEELVRQRSGDRFALVIFAGNTVLKCPLTLDYSFFLSALKSVRPGELSRGGSLMGDAIRYCQDYVVNEESKASCDIILLTDGEDQESFPVDAARSLSKDNIRLLSVGMGTKLGAPVPLSENSDEYLEYEGEKVISRLESSLLQEMTNSVQRGMYIDASAGRLNLMPFYTRVLPGELREGEQLIREFNDLFPWFLLPSFLLFVLFFYREKKSLEWIGRAFLK